MKKLYEQFLNLFRTNKKCKCVNCSCKKEDVVKEVIDSGDKVFYEGVKLKKPSVKSKKFVAKRKPKPPTE